MSLITLPIALALIHAAPAIGPLTMQTLDGRSITMSNYAERRGTVVLFMSSRSPATRAAMPAIARLYEKNRRKDVLFVGVCPNDDETAEELRAFCQRSDAGFPVYRDSKRQIAKRLGAKVAPEGFLLDGEGRLIYRGGFEKPEAVADFEKTITRLIVGQKLERKSFPATGTPIDEKGQPGDAQDPTRSVFIASEVIFDKIPWAPDHHCSTIVEAPNGDLVCVWFGGSYECADDQALFLARRKKGERAWAQPEKFVTGTFLHPPGNAVVFRVSPTRLMVAWDRMDGTRPMRAGLWKGGQLMYRCSDDSGFTWTEDKEWIEKTGGMRNVPIALQDGSLMLPVSGGKPYCWITKDQGTTWTKSGTIDSGGQPTIIQRNDGSLLAFLRSSPFILKSESANQGATWSTPEPTALHCPGAAIAMCRLRNGHVILIFNDSATARTPLTAALSTDEGATWDRRLALESNPGEYSYPCVIQTSDDRIHVTYTYLRHCIKHVEFNEGWFDFLAPPPSP